MNTKEPPISNKPSPLTQTLYSDQWPYLLPKLPRHLIWAYVLWFFWGLLGAHRFYLGKLSTGILYILTGGVFGLGWLYDLFSLPMQVAAFQRQMGLVPGAPSHPVRWGWSWKWLGGKRKKQEATASALLEAAKTNNGVMTVTDGVMATGLAFHEVERALSRMNQAGYVEVRNNSESGVVEYVFFELNR